MYAKNVLIVHNRYRYAGGEDTVVENEKRMLEKRGHKVSCYFRSNTELDEMSRLRKIVLPFDMLFSLRTFFDVRRIIKKEKINIVHVHNTLLLVSPSVYYAAWSCGVLAVQTMHNFRFLCPGATFYRNSKICEDCVKKGLPCAIKHKCYRGSFVQTLASAISIKFHRMLGTYKRLNVICLTEFNKEKLLSVNTKKRTIFDERRIYIKPNFTFEGVKGCFPGNEKKEDYYIFVGRIEEIKGIKVLLKAFSVNGKKLKIVGDGDLKKKVEGFVKRKNLTNIEVLGWLERAQLNELIAGAKALIMPSQWYETFGMTIVEAYSNGVPVIAGEIGNIGQLVEEGKTGVRFLYNSEESLNEAIERLEEMNQPDIKEAAYKVYQEKYSEDVNYELLMNVYRNVLESVK